MKSLKAAFNWLAQLPDRNYTLGEVFQHYARGREWLQVDDNRLNFTRAGRAVERTVTGMGVIGAGMLTTVALKAPSYAPEFLAGAAVIVGACKAGGIMISKMLDDMVRDFSDYDGNVYMPPNLANDVRQRLEQDSQRKLNP